MNTGDRAVRCFTEDGLSCSQSIMCVFRERCGLDAPTAVKLGRAFSAGMGLGSTCGAVTGALMVLGFKIDEVRDPEKPDRDAIRELAREFARRFQQAHGSVECRQLLGVDLGTEEGYSAARARNLFKTACPAFIQTAAVILADILADDRAVEGK